jgi:peroxiredoxin
MSLQDQLDAFKAVFEGTKVPPAAVALMHKATAELVASGQADRALKLGGRAPSFALSDADGNLVSLEQLLANGPLVITFYPGGWCPYCKVDLKAIEEVAADLRARGATVVAISPQTAANSRKSQRDLGLSFDILSDEGGEIANAFGLRFRLPEDLISVYKSLGVDLPSINGEPSWTLPMSARYVVASDGVIAYAEVNPDYTRRPDPSELFPTLDRLTRSQAASPRHPRSRRRNGVEIDDG